MFGETTISYVKIRNHPIETTIYKWLALGFQDYVKLRRGLFRLLPNILLHHRGPPNSFPALPVQTIPKAHPVKEAKLRRGHIPTIFDIPTQHPGTPRPTIYKWLFHLDDCQSLHRKWLEITKHQFFNGCLGFQDGMNLKIDIRELR